MAVSNASLGNLFLTIKADASGALREIKRVTEEAEKASKRVRALNAQAGRSVGRASSAGGAVGGSSGRRPRPTAANDPIADAEKRAKRLSRTLSDIKLDTNPGNAEVQLDALRKRADKLRQAISNLRPQVKTDEDRAALDGLLTKIDKVKGEARELRGVVRNSPDKVRQAGTVGDAVKLIEAETKAAQKAADDQAKIRAKGIADAKNLLAKQQTEAKRAADKAAKDAQRAADKTAREAKRAADKAARETQRAADKAARDASRAAKAAQRTADKAKVAAEKALANAQKKAAAARESIRSGFSRSTSGLFGTISNAGGGLAAVVGSIKSRNVAYAVSSLFKTITTTGGQAAKAVSGVTGAMGGLSGAAGALGPVLGVAVAGALVAIAAAATKAIVSFAGFAAQALTLGLTLKKVFSAGFDTGNSLEQSTIALKAVLGERAKVEQDFLTQRGKASVFDYLGLQELDRTLLAFNVVDDTVRRGLIDTLITLGTVGGRSVDQLQFAARALGQISSNGTPLRQDILQLVQSLGVSEVVLTNLPEYAGRSTQELRKMLEQGLIPATKFFEAMGIYAAQFEGVANEAANTVQGKFQKIADTRVDIGKAFIAAGVQDKVKGLLDQVLVLLSNINFEPIARGFAAVFDAINLGLGNVLSPNSNGNRLTRFFEITLPNALFNVARVANFVTALVAGAFGSYIDKLNGSNEALDENGAASRTLISTVASIAKSFAQVVRVIRILLALSKTLNVTWKITFGSVGAVVRAIYRAIRGDFQGAVDALTGFGRDLADDLNPKDDIDKANEEYDNFVASIDAAAKRANEIEFRPYVAPPITGDGVPAANTGFGEVDQAADDAARRIAELRNQLYELTRRIYGARSELEEGLLGEQGFSATSDQIAQMGIKVSDIIRELGKPGLASAIDQQVMQLMRLADQREGVSQRLEEANERLNAAIKARDDFAEQIRKQAFEFVNALRLEEASVEQVTRFSTGGVAGYIVSQVKKSERFIDVLRRRLKTFKEFQSKTQRLLARGLDKGLLEQLVAAGPEQAGEVVDQLVNGSDQVIREVNSIQRELGQVAVKAGGQQAQNFYQVGVEQARAQAAGLISQIKTISDAAELIGQAIYNAVVPYAQKTADAVGGAVAAGAGARPAPAPRPGPAVPTAEQQQTARVANFLKELQRQIYAAVFDIEKRATDLRKGGIGEDIVQRSRQRGYEFLAAAFRGQIQAGRGDTPYNFQVFIGGEKIAEYVDVAYRDEYNRQRARERAGTRGRRDGGGSW